MTTTSHVRAHVGDPTITGGSLDEQGWPAGHPDAGGSDELEQLAGCDSCGGPAGFVVTYPDVRFRSCGGCLPPGLTVAEPLDPDDELATDTRTPLERQDPRW